MFVLSPFRYVQPKNTKRLKPKQKSSQKPKPVPIPQPNEEDYVWVVYND
jgi:hypothetical protein